METADNRRASVEVDPSMLPAPKHLEGPWSVHFPQGRGAPEFIEMPGLESWTDHPDDGVRYFSGIARYEKEFEVPASWLKAGREVHLDLGRLWAMGRITINTRDQGVVWTSPFRLNVTDALREGNNHLVVEIANTWSNRLVGDAKTEGKNFARTNIERTNGRLWKDVELIPSGLFGPVRLIPAIVSEASYDPRGGGRQ
jgi:hypothetical protein